MKIEMEKCSTNYYLTPENFDMLFTFGSSITVLIKQHEISTFIFIMASSIDKVSQVSFYTFLLIHFTTESNCTCVHCRLINPILKFKKKKQIPT